VNLELCAICARGIAADEPVHVYFSSQGRRGVCERCAERAERMGWSTEVGGGAAPLVSAGESGGRLRGLFGRRSKSSPTAPAAVRVPDDSPDPAAPGRRVEQVEPEPEASRLSPVERALERFNESEVGYTVEGLVRTLGTPWVSVGASAGSPSELRITVAWELSWYQWGIDLGDEEGPVFEIAKGSELGQLDSAARQWNAAAAEGGRIVIG